MFEQKSKEIELWVRGNLEILGLGLSKNQKRWGWSKCGGGWLWVYGGWLVGAWWWLVVGLWTWGCGFGIVEVVSVGLWVCGGWPVRAWQCLAMGLLGWGCGFGIVEVGL